jgi:hypothetical protein
MADRLIEDYLAELGRALTAPPRLHRRALLEARDHLLSAAAAGRAAGAGADEAQEAAIDAFGPADVIARRYVEQIATAAARRSGRTAAVAVLAYGALFAVSTQIAAVRAVSPFADDPADGIGWFAVQIAVTCAALSAVRALRPHGETGVCAGRLRYINRGWGVALAVILVGTTADLVSGIRNAADTTGTWALVTAAGVTAAIAAYGLAAVLVATRRTRALARHAGEGAGGDVLEDLRLLALTTGARLLAPDAVDRARSTVARLAEGRIARAISLRSHPWRFCLLVAVCAGAGLAAGHLVGEGPPTDGLLVLLAVSGFLVAVEAAAIIACFALLGTFLGIRRGPHHLSG